MYDEQLYIKEVSNKLDCVAMAERQTTQRQRQRKRQRKRQRQRVNEKEVEEISFKDNDAAYGNV